MEAYRARLRHEYEGRLAVEGTDRLLVGDGGFSLGVPGLRVASRGAARLLLSMMVWERDSVGLHVSSDGSGLDHVAGEPSRELADVMIVLYSERLPA